MRILVRGGIMDRFCPLGPPERHLDRPAELRKIGADNFSVYLPHDAQDATLDAYASGWPARSDPGPARGGRLCGGPGLLVGVA